MCNALDGKVERILMKKGENEGARSISTSSVQCAGWENGKDNYANEGITTNFDGVIPVSTAVVQCAGEESRTDKEQQKQDSNPSLQERVHTPMSDRLANMSTHLVDQELEFNYEQHFEDSNAGILPTAQIFFMVLVN